MPNAYRIGDSYTHLTYHSLRRTYTIRIKYTCGLWFYLLKVVDEEGRTKGGREALTLKNEQGRN
jgi:hypothetical protein